MPIKRTGKVSNSKVKPGKEAKNAIDPGNNPLAGIFDTFNLGGNAAASKEWEIANNNSYNLISLQRIMLTYTYVLHGPLRTLVDQPVYDAFRGGVKIKTDEITDPADLEKLHKELKKLKLEKKVIEGLRWDRLFGGAGVIINTDQDFKKPFDLKKVNENTPLEFISADRWELSWSGIPGVLPDQNYNYYGKSVDRSRVAKIVGEEAPSLARQRLQGWGMSVIECVIREISAYFKNNNVIFELLDEAKIDIWKIKGFNAQVLSQLAQGKTTKRIQMATYMKNFLNAITLDAEDDYEQKTMTFTGLSDMLEQCRIGIAAAVRMPMAKIFGLAAKGFASGEDDIENYNAIVEGQRERAEDVLEKLVPVVMMKVWGLVPDDWKIEWQPLRVLSAEQEQNVMDAKFNRAMVLAGKGFFTPQETMEYLKEERIVVMDTAVLAGAEPQPLIDPGMEEGMEEPGAAAKKKSGGKPEKKAED